MRNLLLLVLVFALASRTQAQTTAPIEVVNSAIAAVNDLGNEMVRGKLKTSLERMYPQWRERLGRRLGGDDALAKQFDDAIREMMKQGTSMISFKTYGFPKVYEVFPGKKIEMVDGKPVEVLTSTKWLMLIPTVTRFRVMQQQEIIIIESKSFQVAIADKDKPQWTFIDGSGLTIQEMRSLFISLPIDMQLPPIERRTVPKSEINNQ